MLLISISYLEHHWQAFLIRLLTTISSRVTPYESIHEKPLTRLCERQYWEEWSPTAAALDAHMEAIKSITFHLPGIG